MSGDHSRFVRENGKGYTQVLLQQGRVQLDSDWNALSEHVHRRLRRQARLVFGDAGALAEEAGFGLASQGALQFDGIDDFGLVHASEDFSFPENAPFTIEAEVRAEDARAGVITAAVDPSGATVYLLGLDASGAVVFHRGVEESGLLQSAPLSWERDHRITVTYDGHELGLWVDGELRAQQEDAGRIPTDRIRELERVRVEEVEEDGDHELLGWRVITREFDVGSREVTREDVEEERTASHRFSRSGFGFRGDGEEIVEVVEEDRFEVSVVPVALLVGAGVSEGELGAFFDGTLDALRIWSSCLIPGQVANRRFGEDLPSRDTLVGRWELEEGAGSLAADSSGRDHHLVLAAGLPEHRPSWRHEGVFVGAGSYWVEGLECELSDKARLGERVELPEVPADDGRWLAWLEVHERTVTALEDPALLDPALEGADTTVRRQTSWRLGFSPCDDPSPEVVTQTPVHMRARRETDLVRELLGNHLYRVQVHDEGFLLGRGAGPVGTVESDRTHLTVRDAPDWRGGRPLQVRWPGGALETTVASSDGADLTLADPLPDDAPGAVEVVPLATFKWSRDNASRAFAPVLIEANSVRIDPPLDTGSGELQAGDVVEVVTFEQERMGRPGLLTRVRAVSPDGAGIDVEPALPTGLLAADCLVRRWDQSDADSLAVVASPGWLPLEHDIEVSFDDDGLLRTGWAWRFGARSRSGRLLWPERDDEPLPLPPDEGVRHRAPLALVEVRDGAVLVRDLRSLIERRGGGGVDPSPPVVGDLSVRGDVLATGTIRADRLEGRLPAASVHTDTLLDGSVVAAKLAAGAVGLEAVSPELGLLVPGQGVLSDLQEPPTGFEWTGRRVLVSNPDPRWRERPTLPGPTEAVVASVAVDGELLALREDGRIDSLGPDDAWSTVAHLPEPRTGFGAAVLDGKLHVVGGYDADRLPLARHDIFDLEARTWERGPSLTWARGELGVAAAQGLLVVVGGESDVLLPWTWRDRLRALGIPAGLLRWTHPTGRVEVWHPGAPGWLVGCSIPTPRAGIGAASLHDRVHVVGGIARGLFGHPHTRTDHEVFNPALNRWEVRMPVPGESAGGACAAEGSVYVLGASAEEEPSPQVLRYLPRTDHWEAEQPLPAPRAGAAAAADADGQIHCLGGVTGAHRVRDGHVSTAALASTMYVHQRREVLPEGPEAPPAAPALPAPDGGAPPPGLPRPGTTPPSGSAAPSEPPAALPKPAPPPKSGGSGAKGFKMPKFDKPPGNLKRLAALLGILILGSGAVTATSKLVSTAVDWLKAEKDVIGTTIKEDVAEVESRVGKAVSDLEEDLSGSSGSSSSSGSSAAQPARDGSSTVPDACANLPGSDSTGIDLGPIDDGKVRGLDVSHWNGAVPWASLRSSGVAYTFIKTTGGTTKDARFAANWATAKACGILRGGYHFFVPTTEKSAEAQAAAFAKALGDDLGELPPVVDVERAFSKKSDGCAEYKADVAAFIDAFESSTKRKMMIYSTADFWDESLCADDAFANRDLWVAEYTTADQPKLPKPWTAYTFWQWSSDGKLNGSDLDLDVYAGTVDDLKKLATIEEGRETVLDELEGLLEK